MGSEEKAGPDGREEAELWAQEKPRLSLTPQGLGNMTGTTEVVPGISNLYPLHPSVSGMHGVGCDLPSISRQGSSYQSRSALPRTMQG